MQKGSFRCVFIAEAAQIEISILTDRSEFFREKSKDLREKEERVPNKELASQSNSCSV